jgi:hypothetical protein
MKAPVILFSHTYIGKSIAGCPGSGVFKNVSIDVRNHIIKLMKEYGLLISGYFMSITRNDSFIKVPPGTLRQQHQSINYYHCLEKDKGINSMIQERLTSKEINIIYSYNNGPYRFELNSSQLNHDTMLFDNFIDVNNESKNDSETELT